MTATRRPILIAAGGTGGHMFPAVALCRALAARGHALAFVTDPRGANVASETLGLDPAVERHTVSARGLGGGPLGLAKGVIALARGFLESRRLVRELNPAVAVGFGGYPTVPPILAAGMAGVATVIHEQNAVLGRANRRLARGARAFALSFAETRFLDDAGRARARVVGNPVRPDVAALSTRPYTAPDETINLLILGGSLGAQVFSKIVPAAFRGLDPALRARFRIVQQCRQEDIETVRAAYDEMGLQAELATFVPDVPARLAAAHVVICRSGASTVAEITAAGRPALFVPYPHAADGHQMANAREIEAAGGAWVLAQAEFTPAALAGWLEAALEDGETLARVAAAARSRGHPDAAEALADLVESLLPANGNGGERRDPRFREAAE